MLLFEVEIFIELGIFTVGLLWNLSLWNLLDSLIPTYPTIPTFHLIFELGERGKYNWNYKCWLVNVLNVRLEIFEKNVQLLYANFTLLRCRFSYNLKGKKVKLLFVALYSFRIEKHQHHRYALIFSFLWPTFLILFRSSR